MPEFSTRHRYFVWVIGRTAPPYLIMPSDTYLEARPQTRLDLMISH
jgi:hypothetical protein